MQKPIAGTAYFKMNETQLELAGTLKVRLNKVERTGQTGLSGPVGYTEEHVVPYIEIECFVPEGFPMEEIENATDMTATAELVNGKTGLLRNAWLSGSMELDAAAGKMSLKFEGISGEWI